jgi:hypothetical protein
VWYNNIGGQVRYTIGQGGTHWDICGYFGLWAGLVNSWEGVVYIRARTANDGKGMLYTEAVLVYMGKSMVFCGKGINYIGAGVIFCGASMICGGKEMDYPEAVVV